MAMMGAVPTQGLGFFESRGELDRMTRGVNFNGDDLGRQKEVMSYAFGTPNNTKWEPAMERQHATYSPREYYQDRIVFLGTFVTGVIYYSNNQYMLQEPDGLPLVVTNEQKWRWDEILFDLPYVDIVPHEGSFRHVRARKQQGSATTQRRGLGIIIEHDWFMTPAGQVQFGRHVQQLSNAFLYTHVLCAFNQLVKARSAHVTYLREMNRLSVNNVYEMYMQKASLTFPFMRSAQGTRQEVNAVIDALASRNSSLETIHMDVSAGGYFQGQGKENQQYIYAGNRANNWFYQNPSDVKKMPGTDFRVRIATFPDEIGRINPLRRVRITGEYYTMFGLPLDRIDYASYKTSDRSISIYNYDLDNFESISLEDVLDNSMIFTEQGELEPPHKFDDPSGMLFRYGGANAVSFLDLSEQVFPAKLCAAMVNSVVAKGDAHTQNVISTIHAFAFEEEVERPRRLIDINEFPSNPMTREIAGDMKSKLSDDNHYYGVFLNQTQTSTSETQQQKLKPDDMHKEITTRLASNPDQLDQYGGVVEKIPAQSFRDSFIAKIHAMSPEQIGSSLSNISNIARTVTPKTMNTLYSAIDKLPGVEVTSASATTTTTTSSSSTTDGKFTPVLVSGKEIKSSSSSFLPLDLYMHTPTSHSSASVKSGSAYHEVIERMHNIGVRLHPNSFGEKNAESRGKRWREVVALSNSDLGAALGYAILSLRITEHNLRLLLHNDVLFPFGALVIRAFISMVTATALMGKFGRSCGFSPMSTVDAMFGDDVDVKRHAVNYSAYMTSIVYAPDSYLVRDDLFVVALRGGFGTKWFNKDSIDELVGNLYDMVLRNMTRPSIFPLMTTYNIRKLSPVIDMRGKFTSVTGVVAEGVEDVHFITHKPVLIQRITGLQSATTPDPYADSVGYNSICYIGTHFTYHPTKKDHSRVVCGKGWFGQNIYTGCRTKIDNWSVLEEQDYAKSECPL
jgi:hypothetical protein